MTRILATLALLLLAVPAWAQSDNPIVVQMQAFAEAYNVGDADAVAAFYAEDGALFAPRVRNLVGREEIAALYRNVFANGVGNLRFEVVEIRQLGPDAAVEIGEMLVDGVEATVHARYLHVWRQIDGEWMLSRDIYNVIQEQPLTGPAPTE